MNIEDTNERKPLKVESQECFGNQQALPWALALLKRGFVSLPAEQM